MTNLEKRPKPPDPENLGPVEVVRKIGTWFWVKSDKGDWLGCIIHVGSNYVEVKGVDRDGSIPSRRVHDEHFEDILTPEPNPDPIVKAQVALHQENVNELMNKVKQLCSKLGVFRAELTEGTDGPSTALAVAHQTKNIQAHKQALVKAKEKTLPDLFQQIEREHKMMAAWMKAQLLPMKAEADVLKTKTEIIEERIFTVELYAGLVEELVKIQDGEPAADDAKIHLMQRRHYMDEECLAHYEAGGMDYKNIEDFDAWLLRPDNLYRILPHPRCIVAFRIRRDAKERHGSSIGAFIRIMAEEKADRKTFLYIRNGEQVFRLDTEIDFGEQLFPDRGQSTLLGEGNLWIKKSWSQLEVISQREYEAITADFEEKQREYERKMIAWQAKPASYRKKEAWHEEPRPPELREELIPCTPDSVYYDDAMKQVAHAAMEHNRVAVVLQGLLDRSPALHPHPPWQLWTMEGFQLGIELVYDATRVLTPGDKPDFMAYVAKLNASLDRGSITIGQERAWAEGEAKKENDRRARSWRRSRNDYHLTVHYPYGNPGPGTIAKVARLGRDGSCMYAWERERQGNKWVDNPEKRGWLKRDETPLRATFTCPSVRVMNVSAYRPGDFKIFYSDPRTRAEYLRWAPFLLAAEDWHAGKLKAGRHAYETPPLGKIRQDDEYDDDE